VSTTCLLDVEVIPDGTRVCVRPAGEIDLLSCDSLRERLDELWASGCTDVVLDLREVTFMDSAGVHLLIEHHKRAAANDAAFSIIPGGRPVTRVLELTGIDELLTYAPADGVH
jgi:anti-sigma B factor antagonist